MYHWFYWFDLPGTFVLTILLSIYALLLALIFRTGDRFLAMAAMFLSTIGDIILMDYKGLFSKLPVPYFYVGAGFFIAAHIVYILAYGKLMQRKGLKLVNPGFWIGVALVIATFILITVLTTKSGHFNLVMYALCVVYLCIIGCSCVTIFSFSWSIRSLRALAALGALSFFLSDLIIGLDKLGGISNSFLREMIWTLYPIGQIIILLFA